MLQSRMLLRHGVDRVLHVTQSTACSFRNSSAYCNDACTKLCIHKVAGAESAAQADTQSVGVQQQDNTD